MLTIETWIRPLAGWSFVLEKQARSQKYRVTSAIIDVFMEMLAALLT